jgi:alcohol dehydrogenase class IV
MGYDRIPEPGLPLIAIPTTAGTGSEMTKVTVITDTRRNIKMMLLDPFLLPSAALVDYTLTMTMPRPLTAHVGVDALTHGLEAFVSRRASPMTDIIALSCIELVGRHLRDAWEKPDGAAAREGMMLAASQGGMAFSNSSVCLVHGMSRPLGAVFHLPHGLSNAVLLPAVTRFSLSGAPERYARAARALGWATDGAGTGEAGKALIDGLERLNRDLEIPRLRDCGISRAALDAALDKMVSDALESGSPQNNPRIPDRKDIALLYLEAF